MNFPTYPSGELLHTQYLVEQEAWWLEVAKMLKGKRNCRIAKVGYSLAVLVRSQNLAPDEKMLLQDSIDSLFQFIV